MMRSALPMLICAAAWIRTYWATDLFCSMSSQTKAWFISTSNGSLALSKCTFPVQKFWPPPRVGRGHVAIPSRFDGTGRYRVWPDALALFQPRYESGPSDRLLDMTRIDRSSLLGFGSQSGVLASTLAVYVRCDEIFMPFWAIFSASAIPLLLKLRSTVSVDRRRKSGQCIACGFDLRASTDRCPECGHPIPAAAAKPQPPTVTPNPDAPA